MSSGAPPGDAGENTEQSDDAEQEVSSEASSENTDLADAAPENAESGSGPRGLSKWGGALVGVLGIVVGVATSYYFYQEAKEERVPSFLQDAGTTTLVEAASVKQAPIKVVRLDGKPIEASVHVVRFTFWNAGKKSIKREHVLVPLRVAFAKPPPEILDYTVEHVSRPEVTEFAVARSSKTPSSSLDLAFRILEEDDGATVRLIVAGEPTELHIAGAIEGAKAVRTKETIGKDRFWTEYLGFYGALAIGALGVVVLLTVFSILGKAQDAISTVAKSGKPASGVLAKALFYSAVSVSAVAKTLGWIFLVSVVLWIIYLFTYGAIEGARERGAKNADEAIPSELRTSK